jgi:hypothetical protein
MLCDRHQGFTCSNVGEAEQRMLLNSQQEIQLVQYIKKLSRCGILSTQSIIKNYVSAMGRWEPLDAWVTRFLTRNSNHLTSKWTNNIDRNHHHADSEASYCDYFKFLQAKI